ncbi:MAG: polyphosphate kinase [Chloroflexi bacterium]|nr:polyphosphate kinase [Chloroflexota bacterium]
MTGAHDLVSTILSRERSWLRFNHRVLLQATREDVPLLEKLRFLAIFASNLDEFFAARIYGVFERAQSGGRQEQEEYRTVLAEAYESALQAAEIHEQLRNALTEIGFLLLEPSELTPLERSYFGAYLAEEASPRADLLDPGAISGLSSQALYLAAGRESLDYLVRLPDSLPRVLPVPGRPGAFVRLGPLVRLRSDLFLPEDLPMYEMRVTRLANLDVQRVDWDDLAQAIEDRPEGPATRLEVERSFPWVADIREALGLPEEAAFRLSPPLDHRYLNRLIDVEPPRPNSTPLRYEPIEPRGAPEFQSDPFGVLDERDAAFYHPLDDYAVVEGFVDRAAVDPEVDQIRISLYRLGARNPIAEALMRAAEAGKDVAVLLEGRARFDELQNLHWSLLFRAAGIRILPLPLGYKVHAKALYVRRAGRAYVHLCTGNYNPMNGRLYTDISLFSSNAELASDAWEFFAALEGGSPPQLERMRYGIAGRDTMLERIQGEAHPAGHVILKMNHLTDPAIFDALGEAADAGARVDVIARSTLTQHDERFTIRSIVGRFLEHARVAAFRSGGDWEVWVGSADWMPRNFEERIELIFPVLDADIAKRIVDLLLGQMEDDVNAFAMLPDGSHEPRWGGDQNAQLAPL